MFIKDSLSDLGGMHDFIFVIPSGSGFSGTCGNSSWESSFVTSLWKEVSWNLEASGSMGSFWC